MTRPGWVCRSKPTMVRSISILLKNPSSLQNFMQKGVLGDELDAHSKHAGMLFERKHQKCIVLTESWS